MEDAAISGRADEIALASGFLSAVADGPRALAFEGGAGIGKTTLWRQTVAAARGQAFRVLVAQPVEMERQLAFATLADLLGGTGEEIAALPAPQRRALRVALLLEEPGRVPLDERAVATATNALLRRLSEAGPVLVALDDVQWLDGPTTAVLSFALRRLESERVGLLLARRAEPHESLHELEVALHARLTHVAVGPLSRAAVARLLSERLSVRLSPPLVDRVHRVAGGNPFFALELGRALAAAGGTLRADEPLPVPETLREIVQARLSALSPDAWKTLVPVAASARPTLALVQGLVGAEAAARGLAEAETAGIVVSKDGIVRFTHPLLASVLYADEPAPRRRLLHARLAATVTDPEERAYHLAVSAEGPDADVAAALDLAASAAASRGAPAAAAEHAERALAHTPATATDALGNRLSAAAGYHEVAGATARARELLEEVVDLATPGPLRARALLRLAVFLQETEASADAPELCTLAIDEAGDDPALLAALHTNLAWAQFVLPPAARRAQQDVEQCGRAALAFAERAADARLIADALTVMSYLDVLAGRGLAEAVIVRVLTLEREVEYERAHDRPTFSLAAQLLLLGEIERAIALLESVCSAAIEIGDATVAMPLATLASCYFVSGAWDRALDLFEQAREIAEPSGRAAALSVIYLMESQLHAFRAEVEPAEATTKVSTSGYPWDRIRISQASVALAHGDYREAHELLEAALPTLRNVDLGETPPAPLLSWAVEAAAGAGAIEEARQRLAELEELAANQPIAWRRAAGARARGVVFAAEGALREAATELVEARDGYRESGHVFEHARTLLFLGEVERRARHRAQAGAALDEALAIFDRLGARPWSDRARDDLSRIGGRPTRTGALTPTEQQVANLVAQGRSNQEAARQLFMSPKTVEWNLSKIYRKLGVRGRGELAAKLGQR